MVKPGDGIERIAPVALSPSDFVEECATDTWSEAARWSDPAANPAALHARTTATDIFGDFDGPAKRCRSDSTLWRGSFSRSADDGRTELSPVYYKVRWMAPYRFSLVDGDRGRFRDATRRSRCPTMWARCFRCRSGCIEGEAGASGYARLLLKPRQAD